MSGLLLRRCAPSALLPVAPSLQIAWHGSLRRRRPRALAAARRAAPDARSSRHELAGAPLLLRRDVALLVVRRRADRGSASAGALAGRVRGRPVQGRRTASPGGLPRSAPRASPTARRAQMRTGSARSAGPIRGPPTTCWWRARCASPSSAGSSRSSPSTRCACPSARAGSGRARHGARGRAAGGPRSAGGRGSAGGRESRPR